MLAVVQLWCNWINEVASGSCVTCKIAPALNLQTGCNNLSAADTCVVVLYMFLWYNQSLPLQITMMGTESPDDVLLSIIDVSAGVHMDVNWSAIYSPRAVALYHAVPHCSST